MYNTRNYDLRTVSAEAGQKLPEL